MKPAPIHSGLSQLTAAAVLMGACALAFTTAHGADAPKMKMTTDIPSSITIPDEVPTRLGTLKFTDGFPDDATVQKVYDNLTRSMTMNKANQAAISSYDKITVNADGSADLYFGPKAPTGLESNWVDTSASKGWFVWFRFYGPKEPFFNKSWALPDFELVN